jgi:hypothetical protein
VVRGDGGLCWEEGEDGEGDEDGYG